MAVFTATQDGNWADGATWGNTSPGTEGVDWPGPGDSASISYEVTFDVGDSYDSDTPYDVIGVLAGGTLEFPTTQNSVMYANKIGVYGVVQCGTESDPLPKDYSLTFIFPQADSNNYFGIQNTTGQVLLYGDANYYGGSGYDYALLKTEWTSGQTFTIEGDYTTKWNVGDNICLTMNPETEIIDILELNQVADQLWDDSECIHFFTIDSISANGSDTDITVVESYPDFSSNAFGDRFYVHPDNRNYVYNLERNIKIIGEYYRDNGYVVDKVNYKSYPYIYNSGGIRDPASDVRSFVFHNIQFANAGQVEALGNGFSYADFNECSIANCYNFGNYPLVTDYTNCRMITGAQDGFNYTRGCTFEGTHVMGVEEGVLNSQNYSFDGGTTNYITNANNMVIKYVYRGFASIQDTLMTEILNLEIGYVASHTFYAFQNNTHKTINNITFKYPSWGLSGVGYNYPIGFLKALTNPSHKFYYCRGIPVGYNMTPVYAGYNDKINAQFINCGTFVYLAASSMAPWCKSDGSPIINNQTDSNLKPRYFVNIANYGGECSIGSNGSYGIGFNQINASVNINVSGNPTFDFSNGTRVQNGMSVIRGDFNISGEDTWEFGYYSFLDISPLGNLSSGALFYEGCTINGTYREMCIAHVGAVEVAIHSSDTSYWQTPNSGNEWEFIYKPLYDTEDYDNETDYVLSTAYIFVPRIALFPKPVGVRKSQGSYTLTLKVYPTGYDSVELDASNLYLHATFIDDSTGTSYGGIKSGIDSQDTYTNDTWNDITVNIDHEGEGTIFFQLYYKMPYQGNEHLLIDPIPTIT